ncbi:MAG TPA: carboxypeptidase-like regulatory domain-containing protein [Candidatus Polarisedimenticolaceae bacterium]|nr:carboxypeptidase-like regulatory domain-containing protein [Candidatus Polarisedimenticolaceae bacterium]
MRERTAGFKLVAALVVVGLQGLAVPVMADKPTAEVRGSVLSATDQEPVAGARLHLSNPETGEFFSSAPTRDDGGFVIESVPVATYDAGVEHDGGLYVIESPVSIAPGQTQPLQVAIDEQLAPSPDEQEEQRKKSGTSVLNNPATAALLVLGAAIVLGVIIDAATDDDDESASPF